MKACSCGGQTLRTSVRRGDSSLSWQRCPGCGRCEDFKLTVRGVLVAQHELARRSYLAGTIPPSQSPRDSRAKLSG